MLAQWPSAFHENLYGTMETSEARVHFALMPDNFLLSYPSQEFLENKLFISGVEKSQTQYRYFVKGRLYSLPCLLFSGSTLSTQNKLWQKENMIFMAVHMFPLGKWPSPLAELTGCVVAPFTILADRSSTYQSLCAQWHDIAIHPLQGVAGLCFMGPGFC